MTNEPEAKWLPRPERVPRRNREVFSGVIEIDAEALKRVATVMAEGGEWSGTFSTDRVAIVHPPTNRTLK